jgi:hypothetical protein
MWGGGDSVCVAAQNEDARCFGGAEGVEFHAVDFVAAAHDRACAVTRDGTVCRNAKSEHPTPPMHDTFLTVAMRDDSKACFLRDDHAVVCEKEAGGELTRPLVRDGRELSAAGGNVCVINAEGTVLCWGTNAHGELGPGGAQDSPTPLRFAGD